MSGNFTEWLSKYIWLLPLLVAIISAVLVFLLGRESEKKKRYISLADDKLNHLLSNMYKEMIIISEIHGNDVNKVKVFIKDIIDGNELHKTFDDIIIEKFFKLHIQIETNDITEEKLKLSFNHLSRDVEDLYWKTLKAASYDYKWWRNTTTTNTWFKLPMIIISSLKRFFEYIVVFLLLVMVLFLTFVFANYSKYKSWLQEDYFLLFLVSTLIFGIFYYIFMTLFIPLESKRTINKKRIIKKYKVNENSTPSNDIIIIENNE